MLMLCYVDVMCCRCWVSGFGELTFKTGDYVDVMKSIDVPVLDASECEEAFRTTRLGPDFIWHDESFICAGGERGKDTCTVS